MRDAWASTYEWDKKLIDELGLKQFSIGSGMFEAVENKDRRVYLGMIDTEEFSIRVWVYCMPAQFYTFTIKDKVKNTSTKINTGSGAFSRYWPMIKDIAEGMVEINIRKLS